MNFQNILKNYKPKLFINYKSYNKACLSESLSYVEREKCLFFDDLKLFYLYCNYLDSYIHSAD